MLTYFPKPGEKPETVEVIAPYLEHLVVMHGTENEPLHNIAFAVSCFNIVTGQFLSRDLLGCKPLFRERDPANKPGKVMIPSAIEATYATGLSFVGCQFTKLGGSGISLGTGVKDSIIVGCQFQDIAANGINIGEAAVRARYDILPLKETTPQITSKITVDRCELSHCGQLYYGAVGIWVGMANYCNIINNKLHDLPYTGISLGWQWNSLPTQNGGHLVERNHIHHIMQVLSDGAGIYTLGRQPGTILRLNRIHDVPVNAGRAESNGIFMDEGSTAILVERNTIFNTAKSPIRFHKATTLHLRENLLVSQSKTPAFRFNNTPEEPIKRDNNREIQLDKVELLWRTNPRMSLIFGNHQRK